MRITERHAGDAQRLRAAARAAPTREQRDRYLVAAQSVMGASAAEIQRNLLRSRGFVQRWAYAYRDRGIEAVHPKPKPGRAPRIPLNKQTEVLARVAAQSHASAADVRRMLAQEFGVRYSLSGVYSLIKRIRAIHSADEHFNQSSSDKINTYSERV